MRQLSPVKENVHRDARNAIEDHEYWTFKAESGYKRGRVPSTEKILHIGIATHIFTDPIDAIKKSRGKDTLLALQLDDESLEELSDVQEYRTGLLNVRRYSMYVKGSIPSSRVVPIRRWLDIEGISKLLGKSYHDAHFKSPQYKALMDTIPTLRSFREKDDEAFHDFQTPDEMKKLIKQKDTQELNRILSSYKETLEEFLQK